MKNQNITVPFRRMMLIIIALVSMVYISVKLFMLGLRDIAEFDPGAFIIITALLFVINVVLIVLAYDEIKEYIYG